jgi:hypothetical protein
VSSLGDAESSLGDAKSSLGDAKSSLGDAKSLLGDAKSSLGDAESSLGDAESSPGDSLRPDNADLRLTPLALAAGLISAPHEAAFRRRKLAVQVRPFECVSSKRWRKIHSVSPLVQGSICSNAKGPAEALLKRVLDFQAIENPAEIRGFYCAGGERAAGCGGTEHDDVEPPRAQGAKGESAGLL